jgi:type IV pilus assembly protein PilB
MAMFGRERGGKHTAPKAKAAPAPAAPAAPIGRDAPLHLPGRREDPAAQPLADELEQEPSEARLRRPVAVIELREGPGVPSRDSQPGGVVARYNGPAPQAGHEPPGPRPYVEDRPGNGSKPATAPTGRRLGDMLVSEGLVDPEQLDEALVKQVGSGQRLGETLLAMGAVDERSLTGVLAAQFGVGTIDLGRQIPDAALASRMPEKLARDLKALPVREAGGVLDVIVGDLRPGLMDELSQVLGARVQLYAVPLSAARQVIDRAYTALVDVDRLVSAFVAGEGGRTSGSAVKEELASSGSPVAQLVVKLVTQALRDRASDVHVEPTEGELRVRFRIDGSLADVVSLPLTLAAPLVSRVKILANMNIVERRRPQDGQFAMDVDGRGLDVRVSTIATVFGEKCVMRLLDKDRSLLRLHELGMPADTHRFYSKMVRSPFGMVVSAGPTGSGKTTTLYATLSEIDERSRNIVTIEDPVEAVFTTVNQIQTNDQAGVTFADGLRAILRQDPDVIMVGEIRDIDTARIAVQAALTGHFVLTSLHATDSVAALHRFLDMGIEAFLVASSVLGVVSQRLVRRMCRSCAAPYTPTEEEIAFYEEAGGKPREVFLRGKGCNICAGTGYQDRVGVYEFLRMTPEIRRLLVGWATQDELRRIAINQGMRTLRSEGISLVEQDVTTISEVVRSIYTL